MSKLESIRDLCKTNLEYLYKEVCKYDRWNDKLHGYYAGDGAKGDLPGLAYMLVHSGPRKLILMPRNHLKSTVVTVVWSIQQILNNPDIRICINNAKYDTASEFVRTIQAHLGPGTPLSKLFGEFKAPDILWNQDAFIIRQRKLPKAQPTVMAASIGSVLNGKHFDLIINDDLVEPNNVKTKDQIEKVIDFHKDCFNQIDKGGTIVNIGTRWAAQDLYGHLLKTSVSSINGHTLTKNEDWYKYIPTP